MNIYSILLLLIAITAFIMFVVSVQKRGAYSSPFFTYVFLAITIYVAAFFFESFATSIDYGYACVMMKYFSIQYIAPLVFLTILDYLKRRPSTSIIVLLFLPAVAMTVLVATWPLNGIYYENVSLYIGEYFSQVQVKPSSLYYYFIAYQYIVYALTFIVSFVFGFKNPARRKNTLVVLLAISFPISFNVLYVLGLTPENLDLTPYGMLGALILLGYSISSLGAFDILPLAREVFLEYMDDLLIVTNKNLLFIYANSVAKKKFPVLAGDCQEVPLYTLLPIFDTSPESLPLSEIELKRDGGDTMYLQFIQRSVMIGSKIVGNCIILHDITNEKSIIQKLQKRADYDGLTQIYNRATFEALAIEALSAGNNSHFHSSLFLIDIDHFKKVNDTYGHACGDMVLKRVADILRDLLRRDDIFGRLGGEEFGIIIENIEKSDTFRLAEKIRTVIAGTILQYYDQSFSITVSIGIKLSSPGQSYESLFKQADTALYSAKKNGRNLTVLLE